MPLNLLAAYGAGVQVHIEDLIAHIASCDRCDADANSRPPTKETPAAYEGLAAEVSWAAGPAAAWEAGAGVLGRGWTPR